MKGMIYFIILFILLVAEIIYFRVADKCNIIDKPNERSSHSSIVLRGGGIIFLLGAWIWSAFFGFQYPLFLVAVTLAAGISFIDDIHSLPDSVRLIVQFAAMGLLIWQLFIMTGDDSFIKSTGLWMKMGFIAVALIVCVGATNIYNFMDGINGITAGYSAAVLLPLLFVNRIYNFVDTSFLVVALLAIIVFSFFNFRPRGKAKCFAGDVGSVGIAFILLFAIGALIAKTGDITWLVFLLVYGVDGCLTICHRILLHENLGQAHRKHVYQLMANELKISHPVVSLIYALIQLVVSVVFIYLIPNDVRAHWMYLLGVFVLLSVLYILFKKKYYHLHEEYLRNTSK